MYQITEVIIDIRNLGDYVACLGVSEVGSGSDVASIKSKAHVDGNEWVINGGKMWTTNGTQADWMCMLVNTNQNKNPHKSKSLICVPMDTPGVAVHRYVLYTLYIVLYSVNILYLHQRIIAIFVIVN